MQLWKQPPRVLYRVLRQLPSPLQKLLFYLGAAKITLGASAIIWDREGRVLLVHHTYRRPAWGFPSGLVGRREQPADALARELREELGVEVSITTLLHAQTDLQTHHLTLYFKARLHGIPCQNGEEIDQLRYATLQEMAAIAGEPTPSWLLLSQRNGV